MILIEEDVKATVSSLEKNTEKKKRSSDREFWAQANESALTYGQTVEEKILRIQRIGY